MNIGGGPAENHLCCKCHNVVSTQFKVVESAKLHTRNILVSVISKSVHNIRILRQQRFEARVSNHHISSVRCRSGIAEVTVHATPSVNSFARAGILFSGISTLSPYSSNPGSLN